jgi:hypothetical protein
MAYVPVHASADASNRGFFGHGDMQKEFEEASFALKPGEISPVIETASGLHLIERYVAFALLYLWLARLSHSAKRHRRERQFLAWHARTRVHDQWLLY